MSAILGPWWHLPAAFLMTVAGIVGHELAHAVMMYPVAEKVRIEVDSPWLAELHVESEIKDEPWRHRWADLAGLAPLLFGIALFVSMWMTSTIPSLNSVLGWGFIHGLLWFAVLGGWTDYSRAESTAKPERDEKELPGLVRAMSDGGQEFVLDQQRLLTTLSVALLAAGIGLLYFMIYDGTVRETGMAIAGVAMLVSISAVGILLRRAKEYDHNVFASDGQDW